MVAEDCNGADGTGLSSSWKRKTQRTMLRLFDQHFLFQHFQTLHGIHSLVFVCVAHNQER